MTETEQQLRQQILQLSMRVVFALEKANVNAAIAQQCRHDMSKMIVTHAEFTEETLAVIARLESKIPKDFEVAAWVDQAIEKKIKNFDEHRDAAVVALQEVPKFIEHLKNTGDQ